MGNSADGKASLPGRGHTGANFYRGGNPTSAVKPGVSSPPVSSYPRVVMESLMLKAEWWRERNLQEMPLMGEDRLRKEGENRVLSWMIEDLKKEIGG